MSDRLDTLGEHQQAILGLNFTEMAIYDLNLLLNSTAFKPEPEEIIFYQQRSGSREYPNNDIAIRKGIKASLVERNRRASFNWVKCDYRLPPVSEGEVDRRILAVILRPPSNDADSGVDGLDGSHAVILRVMENVRRDQSGRPEVIETSYRYAMITQDEAHEVLVAISGLPDEELYYAMGALVAPIVVEA